MNGNIAFLGSCCVGKTSVFDLLKQDPMFEGWVIQESITRKLFREGVIKDRSFDQIDNQRIIFDEYLKVLDNPNCLSDRSILDVYTFTRTFEPSIEKARELTRQGRLIAQNLHKVTKIFYFPIYWQLIDDNERLYDAERRANWDDEIRSFLQFTQVDVTVVPDLSVKERVKFIKDILLVRPKIKKL